MKKKKSTTYPGLENEAKKYRVSTEIEGFLECLEALFMTLKAEK
jgi:hypothetical protein